MNELTTGDKNRLATLYRRLEWLKGKIGPDPSLAQVWDVREAQSLEWALGVIEKARAAGLLDQS